MLKLKRVQILGFKSFCDRTDVALSGNGIAAIVGPNGCGKSNISDAITWVLGEQSAKSLRGIKMEDVIFAGTRERKPTGMAEVSLTLVDPDVYDANDAGARRSTSDPPAASPRSRATGTKQQSAPPAQKRRSPLSPRPSPAPSRPEKKPKKSKSTPPRPRERQPRKTAPATASC